MNDLVEAMARADTQLELEAAYQAVREHPDFPKAIAFCREVWMNDLPDDATHRPFSLVSRLRQAVRHEFIARRGEYYGPWNDASPGFVSRSTYA